MVLRAFPELHQLLAAQGSEYADSVNNAMVKERGRIDHALSFLSPICEALKGAGKVIVIKSLDHWPDLGSDLDLYTNAHSADVVALCRNVSKRIWKNRSWGDRLANKWNFIVPGLPELVEVHVGRLGQTGEQVAVADSVMQALPNAALDEQSFGARRKEQLDHQHSVDRHFYLRLCDVVETARLVESGTIDYAYLKSLSRSAGLWDGLATYLVTVSGYVKSYRGDDLPLPSLVTDAARFGNELVSFRRKFLRIPIFHASGKTLCLEWTRLLLQWSSEHAAPDLAPALGG